MFFLNLASIFELSYSPNTFHLQQFIESCLFRKEKLQEAHQLQLFKANQRLLLEWSVKLSGEMAEKGLPKTRAEADRLIVEHQDWKVTV